MAPKLLSKFWVTKSVGHKKSLILGIFESKQICGPKKLGAKKIGVQTDLESQKTWVPKTIRLPKIKGPKIFWSQNLGLKHIFYQKIFASKIFESERSEENLAKEKFLI